MVVRLLGRGIKTVSEIKKANPNIIDYTTSKNKKEILTQARSDSVKDKNLKSSSNEQIMTELNYTPIPEADLQRSLAISQSQNQKTSNLKNDDLSWIQKTEIALKTDLPGGFSKTDLKSELLRRETADTREYNQVANEYYNIDLERARQKQIYDEQMDLISKQWYEQWGMFQDEKEKIIRDLQRQQSYYQEQAVQLPNTVKQYEKVTEYIKDNPSAQTVLTQATPESFDWKKGLLIGALALGGLIVISKKI